MSLSTTKAYLSWQQQFSGIDVPNTTTNPASIRTIGLQDSIDGDRYGQCLSLGNRTIGVGSYLDDDLGSASGSVYLFDTAYNVFIKKIKPSDGASADYFSQGYEGTGAWRGGPQGVAIGCGRIVVGAYGDDDLGSFSGSAYIFSTTGVQIAKIKAGGEIPGGASDAFGNAVAIGDGRIVVGAYGEGTAYIYDLYGNLIQSIKGDLYPTTKEGFGSNVAIGSGRIAVTANSKDGTYQNGCVYLFDLHGKRIAKIQPSDIAAADCFGVGLSIGSGYIAIGSPQDDDKGTSSGSVYLYDLNGNQIRKMTTSDGASFDHFGGCVGISDDRVVGGTVGDNTSAGACYVFNTAGTQRSKIAPTTTTFTYVGEGVAVGYGRIAFSGTSGTARNIWLYSTPRQPDIIGILDKYF